MSRRLLGALAVAWVGVGLVACSTPGSDVQVDGPTYASVEELADAAEYVVTGRFTELVDTVDEADLYDGDDGGFVDGDRGMPLDLWAFEVEQTLQGQDDLAGQQVSITQLHPDIDGTYYTADEGHSSVLFLNPYTSGEAFAVVGLGVGSLDVSNGELSAPEGADPDLIEDVDEIAHLTELDQRLS